jgi:ATP-dependent RNA helicase DDX24/MAK5
LDLHSYFLHSFRRDQIPAEGTDDEEPKDHAHDDLQTFIFSATLSKELQVNLKKKGSSKGSTTDYKRERQPSSTLGVCLRCTSYANYCIKHILDDLLLRLDFRDPEPVVIDLSPKGNLVSTLQEGKIECLSGDKVCPCFSLPIKLEPVLAGCLSLLFPTSASR